MLFTFYQFLTTALALSKDDLDKELDSYMFKDEKIGQDLLDKELEDYMANRGNGSNGADAQTD